MQAFKFQPIINILRSKKFMSTASWKNSVVNEKPSNTNLKSWKKIPGLPTLPIIGQMHHFFPGGTLFERRGYDMYDWLYNTYGPIVRIEAALTPKILILYDPDSIAEVLHGENWTPVRPAFFSLEYFRKRHNRTKEESLRSAGLVIEHGERWRDFRRKVNPAMMMPKLVKLYSDSIDCVAVDMIKRLKSKRDDRNMIREHLGQEMNLWSLESIGVIALGSRLNCLDSSLEENSHAMKLIKGTHQLFEISDQLDYKPSLWKYYPTSMFKRAMNVYTDIEHATKYYVSKARENLKTNHSQENERGILEKLLAIDENVANVMATDMLIAGIDTTSNTILATLYHLAKNPEKQQRLRKEITSAKVERRYLKACIKESMRVMPVVGLNFRVTTKEYHILGYKIPKGMGIVFCNHVISLKDSTFPKAKEFIPERWLVGPDDPLYHGNTHPFAHMPFGFGARTCIGRRIAELELETFLTRLIESFNVDWVGPPPKIEFSTINYFRGPYNFVFNDVI